MQPGAYTLTIRAQGFKTFNQSGLQLRTGDVLPVDAVLEVGSTSESVNVTAESPLLETETSSQGTITEGETLYKLPMYQRYITATMTVVPGLTVSTQGGTSGLGAYTVRSVIPAWQKYQSRAWQRSHFPGNLAYPQSIEFESHSSEPK